jgi:hypothetical protein
MVDERDAGECKDVAGKLAGRERRFGIGFGTLAGSPPVKAFVHWPARLKRMGSPSQALIPSSRFADFSR